MPPLWLISNTAGTSHKGLELQGGGCSSHFVKKDGYLPKAPCVPQGHYTGEATGRAEHYLFFTARCF